MQRVLIVEDDPRLGPLLKDYLQIQGFSANIETDGRRAITRVIDEAPDAVVLDIMLPSASGLDVLRAVRPRFVGAVLILTANKADVDQVAGLELGADDYVTKPVEPRVLLARLRSVLRRTLPRAPSDEMREERIAIGSLVIDRSRREVTVANTSIELTGAEFNLLWTLAAHAGEVVSREELYTQCLGVRYDGLDRGVDVHLSRLRKKLAEHGFDAGDVKSVRGAGYLLARR